MSGTDGEIGLQNLAALRAAVFFPYLQQPMNGVISHPPRPTSATDKDGEWMTKNEE